MYPKLITCIINEDVINQCQALYKRSNLELIDYIESKLGHDESVVKLVDEYKRKRIDIKSEDEGIETFWLLMDYLGLTEYLV